MTTENPWLPIDTVPLSTVGTDVDIADEKRLHSNVRVSGIRYEREVIEEHMFMQEGPDIRVGDIAVFVISLTTGSIHLTPAAEWRPHA